MLASVVALFGNEKAVIQQKLYVVSSIHADELDRTPKGIVGGLGDLNSGRVDRVSNMM